MKTLTTDIRRARPQDALALCEVHRAAWRQAYAGLIPHRALTRMLERRGEAWWRRMSRGGALLLVIEVAGVVAGYATLGLNRTPALQYDGEIYEIYLLPQYQGLGFGRQLFAACRQLLDELGCRGLVVWCLEDSAEAMHFFSRIGGSDSAGGDEDFAGVALSRVAFTWP